MALNRVDAVSQYTNEAGRDWNPDNIVPKYFLVYDIDNNVIKKGDGINPYDGLPIWLDLNVLEDIYNQSYHIFDPDVFGDDAKGKLLIITKNGVISYVDVTIEEFERMVESIRQFNSMEDFLDTYPLYSSNISPPIVNGTSQTYNGDDIELEAKSLSNFGDTSQLRYIWELPDSNVVTGNEILFSTENNTENTLEFKVHAVSKTGFRSYDTIRKVKITDNFYEKSPIVIKDSIRLTKIS